MEKIKHLGAHLLAMWGQLGLNQRVSVLMAGTVVLIGLGTLGLWSRKVEYGLLYGRMEPSEAGRVTAALDELKVPYTLSQDGGSIRVPSDKVHFARLQLATKGIPRGEGVGFEIFDKANFGISDLVQRANYVRAIQGELARTIGQMDGVESARVMIVVPENRLLVEAKKHPTASVFVRTRGMAAMTAPSVNAIRFLVANAVEGLTANHVAVVDHRGTVLSEAGESDSLGSLTSTQLAARKSVEEYLARKAEGMLEAVLGPGQAVVRVAAEINFESINRTEEKFDPDGQVERSTTINDENLDTVNNQAATPGGAPGITSNSGDTNNASNAALSNSKTRKTVTNKQYEINKSVSNILQGAGGVTRVSAAVFIASRHEGTGTNRVAVTRKPEELQSLKRIVQSALGIRTDAGATRQDEITLEEMVFNDQQATEISENMDRQEKKQFWWETGTRIAYPVLALVAIMVFVNLFKKTPLESFAAPGAPAGEAKRNGRIESVDSTAITPDVLNRLIRENPENMTEALRTWMGDSNGRAS